MPSPTRRSVRNPSASLPTSRLERRDTVPPKLPTSHANSEDMSEPPRRSRRAQTLGEVDTKAIHPADDEAVEEDEEVTRCVCGQQEYPGPPLSEAFDAAEAGEDAGGLFIQCDGCSVWQHGGCVGIVDESQSPDKYYCELCRPKQHEVHVDANGQHYSLYLPITSKLTRQTSMSKGSDGKPKLDRADTVSRASADPATGKRRGTIRSREHDEEAEQIQRAIEESAREAQGGKRGGKRSREESSDDLKQDLKRQRRASESVPSFRRSATADDESDDEDSLTSKVKKARAEAAQSARAAEQREKEEERERARAEAAGRRRERAGRRRAEEESEDTPNDNGNGSNSPPASSQAGSPAPEKTLQRKTSGKKVKKLGNNQYTKGREAAATASAVAASAVAASSPHNRKRLLTSGGMSSGDEQAPSSDVPSGPPSAQESTNNFVGKGRWGKKKHLNGMAFRHITSEPMERTIPNMARNLEGMMAFTQRGQLGVAEDRSRSGQDSSPPNGLADNKSAMELADQLTRGIRDWQDKFRAQEPVRA